MGYCCGGIETNIFGVIVNNDLRDHMGFCRRGI